jgi:hypothetical protein
MANEKLHYLIKNYTRFSPAKQAYIKRVILSMRRYSREIRKTPLMIDEWRFIDLPDNVREVDYFKCELCGQPENVYQFRIQNTVTGGYIWTGSVCIENFSIPVYNKEGERVTDEEEISEIFKSNVKDMKEQKRIDLIKSLINDINEMSKLNGGNVEYKLTDKNEEGVFTLKQMKFISSLYLKAYGDFISDDYIELFKVNMRLKANKETLKSLEPYQWGQFYPILGKYMFESKHGFTEDIKNKTISIIKYYKPEKVEKFLKKVGS